MFRVVTPWYTYREMVIVELNADETGGGMTFTMKFREIQRVEVGVPLARIQASHERQLSQLFYQGSFGGEPTDAEQIQAATMLRTDASNSGYLRSRGLEQGSYYLLYDFPESFVVS